MDLQDTRDQASMNAFGTTKAEAMKAGICIRCKKPDPLSRCYSEAGRREYRISGMCEECFDAVCGGEED